MVSIFVLILAGCILIGMGVHFIPVGGAPAAISTTAGVPTGAPMITIGMGVTGILITSSVMNQPLIIVLASGIVSSVLMLAVTMLFSNIMHVYGVGVPIASSSYEKDPITGFKQEEYVSPGTTGHGIPTVSFISGLIGAFLGGLGGAIVNYAIYNYIAGYASLTSNVLDISALMSVLLFFILAVLSSYNIGGTIQGVYDKKFKNKVISGFAATFIMSFVLACVYIVILWGLCYV